MTRDRQVLGDDLRSLFTEVLVQHADERFEQLVFSQAASLAEWGQAQKGAQQRDTLHADLQFPAAGLFFRNPRGIQYPQPEAALDDRASNGRRQCCPDFFSRRVGLHVDGSAGGEALQWIATGERQRILDGDEFDSVQFRVKPHRFRRQR